MKKLLFILLILALTFTACKQPNVDVRITQTTLYDEGESIANYESDVRLTPNGFDQDTITVKAGESLRVIMTDDLDPEYLLLNNERIAYKELNNDDSVEIPFDEPGMYQLTDESSKQTLEVLVE